MIKLKIVENDEYANYILKDNDGKKYEVNINFMNMKKPKVGTIIYIDESVLAENVSLNYGKPDGDLVEEKELMIVVQGEEKTYLKRYYG